MLFAHAGWLARRWLAKYYHLRTAEKKTKWLPVSDKVTLKQVKLLFRPLVIQLVWYILKQLFTSVSVKVVDIYLWIIVNECTRHAHFYCRPDLGLWLSVPTCVIFCVLHYAFKNLLHFALKSYYILRWILYYILRGCYYILRP